MEINVGQRLKEIRERLGVSQREIARRSGQSSGAVSAIELGKVSPSVETLKRLLDCLDISLADFFAPEGSSPSSAFFGPDDMIGVPMGLIHYQQVRRAAKNTPLQFVHVVVQPGSDTGNVGNPVGTDEVGYILLGEVEATINGETRILRAGSGYMAKGGQKQRFRNVSKSRCEYVFVTAAIGF
jgi:HTH-type transcriptional regulator, repressor for puuD